MRFSRLFLFSSILFATAAPWHLAKALTAQFVSIRQAEGTAVRMFVAGPEDSAVAVLVIHDYFGISAATREAVEHLGARGSRAMAIDLYGGKSASTHEEAVTLMQALDRKATDKALQLGLDQLDSVSISWSRPDYKS